MAVPACNLTHDTDARHRAHLVDVQLRCKLQLFRAAPRSQEIYAVPAKHEHVSVAVPAPAYWARSG